jgi:hypothetical protein
MAEVPQPVQPGRSQRDLALLLTMSCWWGMGVNLIVARGQSDYLLKFGIFWAM